VQEPGWASAARGQGVFSNPTVIADARDDMKIVCEEISAPVMAIMPFDTVDETIARVNNSAYGLQAGVFTRDIDIATDCARRLEVGGVNINDRKLSGGREALWRDKRQRDGQRGSEVRDYRDDRLSSCDIQPEETMSCESDTVGRRGSCVGRCCAISACSWAFLS